jgi:citrate lyase beta subunit
MPTLETAAVFDASAMRELAVMLAEDSVKERIVILRIGGNDLLNLLGLRRPRGMTIYETPLAGVISQLVTTFYPQGFLLSAPVYEYLSDAVTLAREIRQDLAHGLIGKTAIHPSQIGLIEPHYAVVEDDYAMACRILEEAAPAVFRMHDAMCEVATHRRWAQQIICRHHYFGFQHHSSELSDIQHIAAYL